MQKHISTVETSSAKIMCLCAARMFTDTSQTSPNTTRPFETIVQDRVSSVYLFRSPRIIGDREGYEKISDVTSQYTFQFSVVEQPQ